jgi:RES domain-containing protein
MSREADWSKSLSGIAGVSMTDVLTHRMVKRKDLESKDPADYLFTSGRPGRFNPRGVLSIYGADSQLTVAAEWERYWDGLPQSHLLYFVQFSGLILDLGDPQVLDQLKIDPSDLFAPWRLALAPTLCQSLGQVVSEQTRFAGIRFPSDAARERKIEGYNYVLFKDAVAAPAKVEVRNDEGVIVQAWPL